MIKEEARLAKNQAIAETIKATRAKRSMQICKSREIKIQSNKLNKVEANHLRLLFLEAKWFYNHLLADHRRICRESVKLKSVPVKLPDGSYDERELAHLSSQMKQSIIDNMISNFKILATLKKRGIQNPGALKFKSELRTIELLQYGITYKIDFTYKLLYIQGLKSGLKVNGLEQITKLKEEYGDVEITSAKLINRPNGIFLKISCFLMDNKKRIPEVVGIDMGLGKHITMSNNLGFRFRVDETKRLIALQQKLSRKKGAQKGEAKSKNFKKIKRKISGEHQKIVNKRTNAINHIVSLVDEYEFIAMQDEQIAGWVKKKRKKRNKEIYHTGMGAIKSRLSNLESSRVDVLDKFKPTTQSCSKCHTLNQISETTRVYHCQACGLTIDRDKNSTLDMIIMSKFSNKPVSTEHRNLSPRHYLRRKIKNMKKIPYLKVSSIKEAQLLVAG